MSLVTVWAAVCHQRDKVDGGAPLEPRKAVGHPCGPVPVPDCRCAESVSLPYSKSHTKSFCLLKCNPCKKGEDSGM